MQRAEIARLLPEVFQRTLGPEPNVLAALLAVMEALHAPSEQILAQLDTYFDPDQTADSFVPFLARWVGMDIFLEEDGQNPPRFPGGMGRLRDLILDAGNLAKLRGTRQGLIRMLETATGVSGFGITDTQDKPFHIIVQYPRAAEAYEAFIRRIVELEKPAYVTYELQVKVATLL